MSLPAAFLDRDGTLIEDVDYLTSVEKIRILPGAVEAVRLLNAARVPAIVVTNQAGIARGFLNERKLFTVHEAFLARFAAQGAHLAGVYYCPHHPEHGEPPYRRSCACRKPQPGLILSAARDFDLDVGASMMAGDSPRDAGAGRAAGCGAVYAIGAPPGAIDPDCRGAYEAARKAPDLLAAVREWLAGR